MNAKNKNDTMIGIKKALNKPLGFLVSDDKKG
jgi:hypothetical protein